jgi:hypothetical protein
MESEGSLPSSQEPATDPYNWVRWIQYTTSHAFLINN